MPSGRLGRPGSSRPRVLFSTVCRARSDPYYDYFASNCRSPYRFSVLRRTSYGLRFLKQNIPGIEILEYPSWEEFAARLREGWDVFGCSFYLNETHEAFAMADQARRAGVKEIWAGNYGALTPGVAEHFTRLFLTYAEEHVASALGAKVAHLRHPPLFINLRAGPVFAPVRLFGVLVTQRGCSHRCTFCQTPLFCPRPVPVPLPAIEEVLAHYRRLGIRDIFIIDESFGNLRDHSRAVVELFRKYDLFWTAMARADTILRDFDALQDSGFTGALIGVESLAQSALDAVGKRVKTETIVEFVRRMHEHDRYVCGYYMIGYERDTVESIRDDLPRLAAVGLDFTQLCVITPLPRTPLWTDTEERYGIVEQDWHRFDAKHLTWRHPHISPVEMDELREWGFQRLNPPERYFDALARLVRSYLGHDGFGPGWRYLLSSPVRATFFDERSLRHFLPAEAEDASARPAPQHAPTAPKAPRTNRRPAH